MGIFSMWHNLSHSVTYTNVFPSYYCLLFNCWSFNVECLDNDVTCIMLLFLNKLLFSTPRLIDVYVIFTWLMHSSFVNRGHGLGHGFPWYFWTWCIRSSSTHRGPWPNHGFPCAWDEQQCWGHDLRHAFPSPALSSLWDFRYLMSPLWLRTFWTSVSLVSPLLRPPATRATVKPWLSRWLSRAMA